MVYYMHHFIYNNGTRIKKNMIELQKIQRKLNVPKSLYNKFGGFNYRNSEQIFEAVKPLLEEHKCVLTLSDDIVLIGDRFYVRATATITNSQGQSVSASALAREAEDKKGMDEAQVTGAASSYARKYALGGLFLIDDGQDPDSQDNSNKTPIPTTSSVPKTQTPKSAVKAAKIPAFDLNAAIKEVLGAKNREDLVSIWNNRKSLFSGSDFEAFKTAIAKKEKELRDEPKVKTE